MRCADCKHFESQDRDGDTLKDYGHCSRWHEGYRIRPEQVQRNEAWVEDDEGWGNVVGPDFGCVLFENK
jgi:hypothetical protein